MPTEGQQLFRTRDEIVDSLIDGLLSRVPDAYVGEDGNTILLFQLIGEADESVFLAIQIVADDMFVLTASPAALDRHASDFQVPRLTGIKATGDLLFSGVGGTDVPANTEVANERGGGLDPLFFTTDSLVTIPNPGSPTAPTLADAGAGALGAGTYEYAVTFYTVEGETAIGAISSPITIAASHNINVTNIPVGGTGTIGRYLYRRINGGAWTKLTHSSVISALDDNSTTSFADGTTTLGGEPPSVSTAERVTATATAEDIGAFYNVLANQITTLTDAPDGVTAVTNPAPFTGGEDEELTEDFRRRLLKAIRDPGTGSVSDLESWALEVPGVGSATTTPNDNVGTPTNGHVTVRITGVNGATPSADLLDAVLDKLEMEDLATITIHVVGFTADPINVTADVTPQTGYVLGDIDDAVLLAITEYINNLGPGETFYISGVIAQIMAVPGVLDVVITSPGANSTTASTAKKTVGTLSVV